MRRSRLLLAAISLLLGLLALEGLVRLRQWRRYGTTITSYYRFALDPETGLRIPEPGHSVGPIAVNSLGFRGAEIERPKPPGRIRLAFLGASTTFCAEASSLAATWPELVLAGLRTAEPELDFDLVNGAAGGFTVRESLLNLERRVAPLAPDVIVYYEATNDLTVDTRRLAQQAGLYDPSQDEESPLGRWWLSYYLFEKNLRQFRRTRAGAGGTLRFDAQQLALGFEQRLVEFVRSAQACAPVVALVTFSVQLRPEQPAARQRAAAASALFYMPFLDLEGLLTGYAAYNRAIRAAAAATGALLIEGEADIPGDERHFADSVHLRDPGLELQAARVLAGLRAAPAFQELLASRRAGPRAGD